MLLRMSVALAFALAATGTPAPPSTPTEADAPFRLDHTPPACVLAEKASRLVACVEPRSKRPTLRALFRAEGDRAWYTVALRSDVPCYSGLLPRPSRSLGQVTYFIEAESPEGGARTTEFTVMVAAEASACPGRPAPVATSGRAAWEAPPGAPRTPPGFEGTRPPAAEAVRTADPAAPPAPIPPASKPSSMPPSVPRAPAPSPAPTPEPARGASSGGGHGLRNTAIIVGTAAAGGAALALTRQDEGAPEAPPSGTGLPPGGVSGVYLGTETINYPGGCVGTDDVVLNLQEASGQLTGVLSFTVRTCSCCAEGRGANPVSGSLAGTSLQLTTPSGFTYSGTFAGSRLAGSLAGPGLTGTWTVDKR